MVFDRLRNPHMTKTAKKHLLEPSNPTKIQRKGTGAPGYQSKPSKNPQVHQKTTKSWWKHTKTHQQSQNSLKSPHNSTKNTLKSRQIPTKTHQKALKNPPKPHTFSSHFFRFSYFSVNHFVQSLVHMVCCETSKSQKAPNAIDNQRTHW